MNEVVSPTQNIYPINRVSLFGILSSTVNEKEECHFCLEEIIKDEVFTMDTPCCNHAVHCECFKKWKGTLFYRTGNEYPTPCAYCRAPIPEPDPCYLCLRSSSNEPCEKTRCCLTSVHTSCVNDIIYVSEQLESMYFECAACGCIWTHADMGESWYINLNDSESDSTSN